MTVSLGPIILCILEMIKVAVEKYMKWYMALCLQRTAVLFAIPIFLFLGFCYGKQE